MTEVAVTFACESETLLGVLHRGHGAERSLGVLIVVGGPQYRVGSHRQFVQMARRWAAASYPVLRFDYRGMGDSSGEPRTFESVSLDIRAAVDAFFQLCANLQGVVIFGLCDAASAALMYCTSDTRIRGLMLANPWVRTPEGEATSYMRHYYTARIQHREFWVKLLSGQLHVVRSLREFATAGLLSLGRKSQRRSPLFIDQMLLGMQTFDGPVLLLISELDLTAAQFVDLCKESPPWGQAIARTGIARADMAGADHTFSTAESLARACVITGDWLAGVAIGRQ